MWRVEDQALLERLENEALLRRVWARLTRPNAPPPTARAAGLLHLVRESAEGERAARRALEGDVEPLVATLRPPSYRGLRPILVHHLALLHHASARALDPEAHDEAMMAYEHALSAWASLVAEGAYLRQLAAVASAGALSAIDEAACAAAPPTRLLAELAESGRADLDAHGPRARLALRVLARAPALAQRAGDSVGAEALAREATRLRRGLVDALLQPLQNALDEASARGTPDEAHLRAFARGVDVWRFTDADVDVERLLIDQAIPIAWELYGQKRWELFRRLDRTLAPVVDSLAARVAKDPELVAYASRCAQMLVFRAELEPRFEAQITFAERAVGLCETHRNGRLVLADLLAQRALRSLDAAPIWDRRKVVLAARDDLRRARTLFPDLERLRTLEAALLREGVE